ncbi:MAG TPA: hypothetical protein VJ647_03580 [Chitinophagaceae bacterium]|nr:hypothetical protein [Chitinophagaceae bacterium]
MGARPGFPDFTVDSSKFSAMETWMFLLVSGLITVLALAYIYFYFRDKKENRQEDNRHKQENAVSAQLRFQAYERLVLLADRIALPNLISRMNVGGLSAREMQLLLIKTIKEEFEHNVTQQIYVNPAAWEALRNLKEQNLLIINQIGSFLPESASGADLNKALMELLVQNPQASLHTIVSEAISFEAKKMMV